MRPCCGAQDTWVYMRLATGSSQKQITPQCLSDGAVNYSTGVPALHSVKAIFIEVSRDSDIPENSAHVGGSCKKRN